MEGFEVTFSQGVVPAAFAEALGECESLRVPRLDWANLIRSMGVGLYEPEYFGTTFLSLDEACKCIVKRCSTGDVDQLRYVVNYLREDTLVEVAFVTPGEVTVVFSAMSPEELVLTVKFGRDSTFLATMMAAWLVKNSPTNDPNVRAILARAANELAAM